MSINIRPDTSFLFSSLSSSKSGTGLGNLNFLSDYASIKNGSYGKLLKAYYNKMDNDSEGSAKTADSSKRSTSLASDSAKTLASIDSAADKLKESADALIKTGSDSLFKEKEVTVKNEDGTTTKSKQYDKDAIYKAVSSFVSNYNLLLDSVNKSDSSSILKSASNMTNITGLYTKTLEKAGITVGNDNKLTIDKEGLEAADISTLKSIFNDSRSFAYNISFQASFIDYAASREAAKANTYNQAGSYNNNFSMGNIFNSLF